MKKMITLIVALFSLYAAAQTKEAKKLELTLSYSLSNDDNFYKNPWSALVTYQLKHWESIALNVGFRTFIFSSESKNFSTKFGFNPNVGISYAIPNSKFHTYLLGGYYFDNYKFTPTPLGGAIGNSPDRTLTTNGVTITPAVKCFVTQTLFIDMNLTLLFSKTKDDFGTSQTNNNTFFNIGLGVAF